MSDFGYREHAEGVPVEQLVLDLVRKLEKQLKEKMEVKGTIRRLVLDESENEIKSALASPEIQKIMSELRERFPNLGSKDRLSAIESIESSIEFFKKNKNEKVARALETVCKELKKEAGVNPEVAAEFGLVKKELPAFPEADRLIREIAEKKLDPSSEGGRERLCKEWPADCPPPFVPPEKWWKEFYPNTAFPEYSDKKNGNFWYVQELANGHIIDKDGKPFLPDYSRQTVYISNRPDEDYDATDKAGKRKLQTEEYNDKLLNELLLAVDKKPHIGAVNIRRDDIDAVLGNQKAQAAALKRLVGDDWQNWEIRCANQREIEGKKWLWTHLDGYFLAGDGVRRGLGGGVRGYGGASGVDGDPRAGAAGALAVRLVLSPRRK